jgi:hypothetical protein
LRKDFPKALSYSRFIQLEPRCFMTVMFFLILKPEFDITNPINIT